ncbi:cytochrome c oxidase subunit II [Paraburkholderia sp. MMS20-SJTN17]|uniref:cytochrome-c oxidase n=1 Tax=Paraburkholderia translucens TaxID=2886945 RepID=A0ABS8KI66_9BURK|nr:cytochrome c oxidase subunit II [Paraburkholderia sp. MMS20-SJTN17]MCC8404452.1 cytochrome c oxidase subunit II [Paraburkholderia sp. MMS20-SJTN17]
MLPTVERAVASAGRSATISAWRSSARRPLLFLPLLIAGSVENSLAQRPPQDALHPAGVQAAHILRLWHISLIVCGAVFAAVLFATLVALLRRTDRSPQADPSSTQPLVPAPERGPQRAVAIASIVSVALLLGLIVADVVTDRALSRMPVEDALHLQVTGEQWWWKVDYPADGQQPGFSTANEFHVPVGRPVIIELKAGDVIHSFWMPNLHGKKDMLPGLDSTIEFRADKPGLYRGQCAEYCGAEHAWMAMFVTADPPERYAQWRAQQAALAVSSAMGAAPAASAGAGPAARIDTLAQRGLQIFEQSSCASCHTVRGTSAQGTLGPDLTHLMSRHTIGAGVLPNTQQNLTAWIRDPEAAKPGTTMPKVPLTASDRQALVAWLGTLR